MTEPVYDVGDLNHDGEVSLADLVYCAEALLGKNESAQDCDMDNNGSVDVFDMIYVRKLVLEAKAEKIE